MAATARMAFMLMVTLAALAHIVTTAAAASGSTTIRTAVSP